MRAFLLSVCVVGKKTFKRCMKVFAARDAARRKGRFCRSLGRAAMARPSSGRRSSRRPRRPFLPEARKGLAEEESRLPRGGRRARRRPGIRQSGRPPGNLCRKEKTPAAREGVVGLAWGESPPSGHSPFPERSLAEGAAGAPQGMGGRDGAPGAEELERPNAIGRGQTGRGSG